MLALRGVHAYYGESHILHGMTLTVETGEVATLVGRNGVGKTTTLRTIMGILPARQGQIELNGSSIVGIPSDRIARRGLGYVPEERGILSTLSVYENLTLAPIIGKSGWTVERIFDAFPNLKERAKAGGTTLSGGEQQMLAIARVLRSGARTVLLVEQNVRFATDVADRHHVIVHGHVEQTLENREVIAREKELLDLLGV